MKKLTPVPIQAQQKRQMDQDKYALVVLHRNGLKKAWNTI